MRAKQDNIDTLLKKDFDDLLGPSKSTTFNNNSERELMTTFNSNSFTIGPYLSAFCGVIAISREELIIAVSLCVNSKRVLSNNKLILGLVVGLGL